MVYAYLPAESSILVRDANDLFIRVILILLFFVVIYMPYREPPQFILNIDNIPEVI